MLCRSIAQTRARMPVEKGDILAQTPPPRLGLARRLAFGALAAAVLAGSRRRGRLRHRARTPCRSQSTLQHVVEDVALACRHSAAAADSPRVSWREERIQRGDTVAASSRAWA